MEDRIKELRNFADQVFREELYKSEVSQIYIETFNDKDQMVLAANREGFLYLAAQMIRLADDGVVDKHYHLDEHSVAYNLEKPIIIIFAEKPNHPQTDN